MAAIMVLITTTTTAATIVTAMNTATITAATIAIMIAVTETAMTKGGIATTSHATTITATGRTATARIPPHRHRSSNACLVKDNNSRNGNARFLRLRARLNARRALIRCPTLKGRVSNGRGAGAHCPTWKDPGNSYNARIGDVASRAAACSARRVRICRNARCPGLKDNAVAETAKTM